MNKGLAILQWTARLAGAGLLGATAGIHLYLWNTGYRSIHVIGELFLLNGVGGSLLCLAVTTASRRLLGWVAAAGAGMQAATVGALLLSLHGGLFGFVETWRAPYVTESVAVEVAGTVVLAVLAAAEAHRGVVARRSRAGGRQEPRWSAANY